MVQSARRPVERPASPCTWVQSSSRSSQLLPGPPSVPLYDGLRPISEPAAPYLDRLRGQIARARRENPGFKGVWVYFFVRTSAD
ncbi:MAG: hypothetical protein ACK5MY_08635 [Jhaorihella sp.]